MPHRFLATLAGALAFTTALPAHAVGQHVDVQMVDRATGEVLAPIRHDGAWWVAGTPGARYRVRLVNRDGRRTLNVLSIDGVNAVSGDTAAWSQSGYVIEPLEATVVDGWRKSADQVAAFTFASLPDSYAARTGRPANVGVIGIAIFHERPAARPRAEANAPPVARRSDPLQAPSTSPAPASESRSDRQMAASVAATPSPAASDRLGTGHGAIEDSFVRWVAFTRARSTPDEIVTIHYDRLENLIAMGIVPRPVRPIAGDPFPGSHRFVPDPPAR